MTREWVTRQRLTSGVPAVADESLRETVARALSDAVAGNSDYDGPISDLYRQLADAAISVLRGDDA